VFFAFARVPMRSSSYVITQLMVTDDLHLYIFTYIYIVYISIYNINRSKVKRFTDTTIYKTFMHFDSMKNQEYE